MGFDPEQASSPDSGIFGLESCAEDALCVLVPVGFDATTSYRAGTRHGPEAVLQASRQLDLYSRAHGRPYEHGICLLPPDPRVEDWNTEARKLAGPIIEAGGTGELASLQRIEAIQADLRAWLRTTCDAWLKRGRCVGVLGGDHSVPLGAIAAHAARWPGLGILHIDAHHDLRVAYEGFRYSHASIMANVLAELPDVARIVSVGIRDFSESEQDCARDDARVCTFYQEDLEQARFAGRSWNAQVEAIVAELPGDVYVSFDIDGLDPSLCPNTGTPVPGGLRFAEVVALMRAVVASGRRLVGFDLVEVAPGEDEWDGNVGARLLYELIALCLASR